MTTSDILVVGGGPAGCVAATLLAKAGLKVVQAAGADRRAHSPAEVLGPGAVRKFEDLSFKLPSGGAMSCRGLLSRWRSEDEEFSDYDLLDVQRGAVLARASFHARLAEWAEKNGVLVLGGTTVAEASFDGTLWNCSLAERGGMSQRRCRWIVDASGRGGSPIAPPAAMRIYADQLVAVAAPAQLRSLKDCLIIDCSDHEWWYAPPSPDGLTHVVYLTDIGFLPEPGPKRCAALATAFRRSPLLAQLVDDIPDFEDSHLFDARFSARGTIVGKNWVCIGDAALALDPLSGHGVISAIDGATKAAQGLVGMLKDGFVSSQDAYCAWHIEEIGRQSRIRSTLYGQVNEDVRMNPFWQRRSRTGTSGQEEDNLLLLRRR